MSAAIRPRPRAAEDIYADVHAQQILVGVLRELICDCYARDCRPLIVRPGELPERVGPDPVPLTLREHLQDESAALARLEHEFVVARQARE